jgi:hypothetical protein
MRGFRGSRLAAGLLAGLAVAGCAARASGGSPPGAPAAGIGHARLSASAAPKFCAGRPPAAIVTALSRAVPESLRDEVVPLGISASGRTAYVSAWTRSFSGVAALSLPGGALRPILRFDHPATDQADGAWGGTWLVWEQTYSLQSLDGFTVYGWNSVTGTVSRLGHSLASRVGIAWPSPWHAPAVSGDFAAWAQGYGPGGLVQIRLADLRTGKVTVVARGHVQAPFFDGDLLVWPGSDRPGAKTRLHAYSLATQRPAALPVVLRPVRGTDFVATDGIRTAYLSPDLTELFYSAAPGAAAAVVLRLPAGVQFAELAIGRGVLAWTSTEATYLASTVTGAYVRVTPKYGYAVTGQGGAVLVSDPPASKAAHPALALHVVESAAIGARACGR